MSADLAPSDPRPLRDADATDAQIIEMWLHGRPETTLRLYRYVVRQFFGVVDKPLRFVTLGDLQTFERSLVGAQSSRKVIVHIAKSLISFAHRIGALPVNVGAALRVAAPENKLTDRILAEEQVSRMLALTHGRDHALVRLLYASGFRISELVKLRWSDLADAPGGGCFASVLGKGRKARTVRISAATTAVVLDLRRPGNEYVFRGRVGKPLSTTQAWRVVRKAALLAGLDKPVSPHWMRHAHASHAIDRGAKLPLVRDTLGHSSLSVTDRYAHARPGESSGSVLPV